MSKTGLRNFCLLFCTLDIVTINWLCFKFIFNTTPLTTQINTLYIAFFVVLNTGIGLAGNFYKAIRVKAWKKTMEKTLTHPYRFVLAVSIFAFLLLLSLQPQFPLAGTLSGIVIILFINRVIFYYIHSYLQYKFTTEAKTIIIGYNSLSKALVEYLEGHRPHSVILGFCEDVENISELSKYPVLGGIDEAVDICRKYAATQIYQAVAPKNNDSTYRILESANRNCIRYKMVHEGLYISSKSETVQFYNSMQIISFRKEPLNTLGNRVIKRMFDIMVSSLVMIFINSWLIPIVALLVRIESKGPVFFKQERSGKHNKTFFCFKFRSMYVNSDSDKLQAIANDTRVTKTGKFLRRTSLDEFPQFINVLLGDMSIIGPRPHMLQHTEEYSKLISKYMVRHFIKPGITGWAQVNGFRGQTKNAYQMKKRVQYDIWYIENWNFLLDIKIIALTVFNTLKGEKNAF